MVPLADIFNHKAAVVHLGEGSGPAHWGLAVCLGACLRLCITSPAKPAVQHAMG